MGSVRPLCVLCPIKSRRRAVQLESDVDRVERFDSL